jgi:tetratricopeptide (TPR) repeat protein
MIEENGSVKEAELMFKILDFARTNERRIYDKQIEQFKEKGLSSVQKLVIGEYLQRVAKGSHPFYTMTAKGLNLFKEKRKKTEIVPERLKNQIIEKLDAVINELEMKPWELMFYIIHVIGNNHPIATENILTYFRNQFPNIKGISRASIYRNLKKLRMKKYIKYRKMVYSEQRQYNLSEKGKEIFHMTREDAAHRLRTSEEWDEALKYIFEEIDEERKQTDEALFHILSIMVPNLEDTQLVWILYTKGTIYELKGRLNDAEEEYLHMERICEEMQDSKGRAYALKGLGNVAFKQRRYGAAEQYYNKCQKYAQGLHDDLLLSDILNNLGACLYTTDDVDKALKTFEKAVSLAGDDASRVASTLYNQGLCYARKEDLPKAKELWQESLTLYQSLQKTAEIAKVEHNIREIDRKQKREYLEEKYREAKQYGTTADAEKAYKELARFIVDGLKQGVRP